MGSVLIVDDEESICWSLERRLAEDGHETAVCSSAEDALARIGRHQPDLVVLDVRLPGMDGLTAIGHIRQIAGPLPILVITAFGSLDVAVSAVRNGAYDYLVKPFDLEHAARVIASGLARRSPGRSRPAQEGVVAAPGQELLGRSAAMQEVFKRIALVAATDSAVLISGESGTGKELVARAIHAHSPRASGPWVPVNLAALSPSLVESELFGHRRGAFTGAEGDRQGLLELADGGTVFFDEVADIPLAVQVKLLRVLEQRELTPVGETRPRTVDFRVLAATHRDLRTEVRECRFRADLFYRLAVFEIGLPPLRERADDVPLLAERFLASLGLQPSSTTLGAAAITELTRRRWPGNVRELRNAVEHAALLARGGEIAPFHLPPEGALLVETHDANDGPAQLAAAVKAWADAQLAEPALRAKLYYEFLGEAEPALFQAVLAHTGHNQVAAARILGIDRATLRKKAT
jgi:two-component system nitrogen regulation response regulator GlnG